VVPVYSVTNRNGEGNVFEIRGNIWSGTEGDVV
jgi:hypothetical protein